MVDMIGYKTMCVCWSSIGQNVSFAYIFRPIFKGLDPVPDLGIVVTDHFNLEYSWGSQFMNPYNIEQVHQLILHGWKFQESEFPHGKPHVVQICIDRYTIYIEQYAMPCIYTWVHCLFRGSQGDLNAGPSNPESGTLSIIPGVHVTGR